MLIFDNVLLFAAFIYLIIFWEKNILYIVKKTVIKFLIHLHKLHDLRINRHYLQCSVLLEFHKQGHFMYAFIYLFVRCSHKSTKTFFNSSFKACFITIQFPIYTNCTIYV